MKKLKINTISRLKSGVSSVTPGGRTGVALVTRTTETPLNISLSFCSVTQIKRKKNYVKINPT